MLKALAESQAYVSSIAIIRRTLDGGDKAAVEKLAISYGSTIMFLEFIEPGIGKAIKSGDVEDARQKLGKIISI